MSQQASLSQAIHACSHPNLNFASSRHADEVGYRRINVQQRTTAAGKKKNEEDEFEQMFPAPLVLPGDELAFDPKYSPQSLLSWVREKSRNEVTRRRNVLYVAGPPEVTADVAFARDWGDPQNQGKVEDANLTQPALQDVVDYLGAFYYGVQVKALAPGTLKFSAWDQKSKRGGPSKVRFIGLDTTTESVGIRVRSSPDGVFQGQINLDDLLDTAISVLPDDAYALLMLVEQDLFEDEDDDFCCGRAYGGSRVCVVSMARYNPTLDVIQNVERQHSWPASHCQEYMDARCEPSSRPKKIAKKAAQYAGITHASSSSAGKQAPNVTPLKAAVTAHNALAAPSLSGLWLSRVCQTASHELGHCFGMDHCVYYACAMQSTSSLAEDVRQPPYLCPVDLAKVLRATGAQVKERYEAMHVFCEEHKQVPMFAAFSAWLSSRLEALGEQESDVPVENGSRQLPIEL